MVEARKGQPYDYQSYVGYYGDGVTRGEGGWSNPGRGLDGRQGQ